MSNKRAPQNVVTLWPAFGLGLSVAVSVGLARFSYALILPAMQVDLAWNYAQAGWLNTANALGYVAGAVSGYFLLRRLSPAWLFSAGLYLTFLALPATALSAQIGWLTIARLLSGIGAAWTFSCGVVLVHARYRHSQNHGGTATGLFFAGAGLGIALSGVVVSPMLAHWGVGAWPQAWLLLGLAAALLSIWPLREARRPSEIANAPSDRGLSMRGLWTPLLGYFVFASGYIVYMTFIIAWMHNQGWSWLFGLSVWLILGGGVAVSPFVWRRALNRWPPEFTLSASCLSTLIGAAIPIVDPGKAGLLCSAAIFGLGVFIAPSSVAVLVRRQMSTELWARGMTLFTVVFALGQVIGPVAAGWIADVTTLNGAMLFGIVLLLVATLLPLAGMASNSA